MKLTLYREGQMINRMKKQVLGMLNNKCFAEGQGNEA